VSGVLRGLARSALACAALWLACERQAATPPPAPPSALSLWQFAGRWQRVGGGELELAALRGQPAVLLFFYGSCDSACPILVHDLERVAGELPPAARDRIRFVLVTIDPERDTAERLSEYARDHGFDPARWVLLRGTPDQVRELASAAEVRYRDDGTGTITHTKRILLLDRDGVPTAHWDGLERPLEPIVRAISEAAQRG
jgi:protein SCO1/2